MAEHAHIVRRVSGLNAARIRVKGYIQYPMHAVLDTPVSTYQCIHACRIQDLAQPIVALFGRGRAIERAFCFNQCDALERYPALAFVQLPYRLWVTDHECLARLDPSVGDIYAPGAAQAAVFGLERCTRIRKQRRDIGYHAWLVALQRQDILTTLANDLFGNRRLAPERINRNRTAMEFEQRKQLWNGGDLVRFVVDRHLSEHQTILGSPSADEM